MAMGSIPTPSGLGYGRTRHHSSRPRVLRLLGPRQGKIVAPLSMHSSPLMGTLTLTQVAQVSEPTTSSPQQSTGSWMEKGMVNLEDPGVEVPTEAFNWYKNWWPVAVVDDLDKKRPHPVTVLGRRYVIWWDVNDAEGVVVKSSDKAEAGDAGEWRCFDDACSHRLAPLSEGRIESDGTLQCSYHGWRFCGSGKCTTIPQAEDSKAAETACNSSRSAVTSYPTKAAGGMLFIWPDATPESKALAASTYIPVPPAIENLSKKKPAPFFMRHLPYSYEMLLENLTDPAHLPFSHHGIGILNREKGGGIDMADVKKMDKVDGSGSFLDPLLFKGITDCPEYPYPDDMDKSTFELIHNTPDSKKANTPLEESVTDLTFFAPNHVRYLRPRGVAGMWSGTFLYLTPTMPGKSLVFLRSFALSSREEAFIKPLDKLKAKLMDSVFGSWLAHDLSHNIFDGDGVFLHYQGENMRISGQTPKDYYLATSADGMVAKCLQWMQKVAGGGPSYPPGAPLPAVDLPRQLLLDRFDSHTKHCKKCRSAMDTFSMLQMVAAAGAVACLLALAVTSGALLLSALQTAQPQSPAGASILKAVAIGSGIAAFLFAALWEFCGNMVQRFIFVDYVHAEKH